MDKTDKACRIKLISEIEAVGLIDGSDQVEVTGTGDKDNLSQMERVFPTSGPGFVGAEDDWLTTGGMGFLPLSSDRLNPGPMVPTNASEIKVASATLNGL